MTGVFSFLGGAAFRMIWGEVSAYFNKKQDHKHEVELLRLQDSIDAGKHQRQQELIQLQHTLGIKEIQVAGQVALDQKAADAFMEAVKATNSKTGVWWVDAWNAMIRPGAATIALAMLICEVIAAGWVIPATTADVFLAFLGIFVANRDLHKRGK
jgi:hypothetical protein